MPTFSYTLEETTPPAPSTGAAQRPYATYTEHPLLGFGLLRPFVRDQKGDFATGGGEVLVRACVGQVLGTIGSNQTTQGELPWRPEFGSLLNLLRQKPNDPVTAQLARVYVADALQRWEPRVRVKAVTITREKSPNAGAGGEDVLVIGLRYDFIANNTPGNEVVVPDLTQVVRLPG